METDCSALAAEVVGVVVAGFEDAMVEVVRCEFSFGGSGLSVRTNQVGSLLDAMISGCKRWWKL